MPELPRQLGDPLDFLPHEGAGPLPQSRPKELPHLLAKKFSRHKQAHREQNHSHDPQRAGDTRRVRIDPPHELVNHFSDGKLLLLHREDEAVADFEHGEGKREDGPGDQIGHDERERDLAQCAEERVLPVAAEVTRRISNRDCHTSACSRTWLGAPSIARLEPARVSQAEQCSALRFVVALRLTYAAFGNRNVPCLSFGERDAASPTRRAEVYSA